MGKYSSTCKIDVNRWQFEVAVWFEPDSPAARECIFAQKFNPKDAEAIYGALGAALEEFTRATRKE